MNNRTRTATEQAHLVALARAAYARRATVRRRLRHTNTDVRTVLTRTIHTDADLGNLTVRSVLLDLPGLGPSKVDALLAAVDIRGYRRIRTLRKSEAQRLADRLDAA